MQAALWAQALQDSSLAALVRGGAYVYPFVNILHILAVGLIVGSILALDFRILGFVKAVPAEGVSKLLTPFTVAGILIALPSGFALYASDAVSLSQNKVMWIKLALIVLGIANAFLFRRLWNARLPVWDRGTYPIAKLQALLSIVIWITVPVLGRLIAYI
jgi:hypothetical protein